MLSTYIIRVKMIKIKIDNFIDFVCRIYDGYDG